MVHHGGGQAPGWAEGQGDGIPHLRRLAAASHDEHSTVLEQGRGVVAPALCHRPGRAGRAGRRVPELRAGEPALGIPSEISQSANDQHPAIEQERGGVSRARLKQRSARAGCSTRDGSLPRGGRACQGDAQGDGADHGRERPRDREDQDPPQRRHLLGCGTCPSRVVAPAIVPDKGRSARSDRSALFATVSRSGARDEPSDGGVRMSPPPGIRVGLASRGPLTPWT